MISVFPVTIETLKSGKIEHVVVRFLHHSAAPVPGGGESTIDAWTSIVTITIETVFEVIWEDG
jgi:hypothetical protein